MKLGHILLTDARITRTKAQMLADTVQSGGSEMLPGGDARRHRHVAMPQPLCSRCVLPP